MKIFDYRGSSKRRTELKAKNEIMMIKNQAMKMSVRKTNAQMT